MLGTLIDAYYQGYDVILVSDATATTSPDGGYENVIYNAGGVRPFTGAYPGMANRFVSRATVL